GNLNDTVNLAGGSTITYTVTGTIPSSTAPGSLSDTATVTPPSGVTDTNNSNNAPTATVSITRGADLEITNTDGMPSVSQGASNTYTVVVTNIGPSDVSGATVTDIAPAAFTVTGWTAAQSGGATGF